jgi:hypothetical protein
VLRGHFSRFASECAGGLFLLAAVDVSPRHQLWDADRLHSVRQRAVPHSCSVGQRRCAPARLRPLSCVARVVCRANRVVPTPTPLSPGLARVCGPAADAVGDHVAESLSQRPDCCPFHSGSTGNRDILSVWPSAWACGVVAAHASSILAICTN